MEQESILAKKIIEIRKNSKERLEKRKAEMIEKHKEAQAKKEEGRK